MAGNRHIDAVHDLLGRMLTAQAEGSVAVDFTPDELGGLERVLEMADIVDIQHEARQRFFAASRVHDGPAMDAGAKEQDAAYVRYRKAKDDLMRGRER